RAMSIADILKHEGRQLGLREGQLKKTLEIARNMLSKGMSVATIADVTQLPSRDIKKLQQISR
ncbi:MAG: hypothetical protein AAF310_02730, partial [Myxococcota bacterium]